MPRPSQILVFFAFFVVCFVALLFSWSSIGQAYGSAFRGIGNTLFGSIGPSWRVSFTEPVGTAHYDAIVELKNLKTTRSRTLGGRSRTTGFEPTVYVVALIVATPLSWRRRLRALGWGLLIVNLYVLFRLFVLLFSTFLLDPVLGDPAGPPYSYVLQYLHWVVVKSYYGIYGLPLIIWFLCSFRRSDFIVPLPKPPQDDTDHHDEDNAAS
jgi:hypothetical protein